MTIMQDERGWVEVVAGVRVHRPAADVEQADGIDDLIRDLERRAARRGPITIAEVMAVLAAAVLVALAVWPVMHGVLS